MTKILTICEIKMNHRLGEFIDYHESQINLVLGQHPLLPLHPLSHYAKSIFLLLKTSPSPAPPLASTPAVQGRLSPLTLLPPYGHHCRHRFRRSVRAFDCHTHSSFGSVY